MPTVKWLRGFAWRSSSSTAFTIAGVNSLEANPKRPPISRGGAAAAAVRAGQASCTAFTRSR